MNFRLDDAALGQLFRQARSLHTFKPDPVSDQTLHELYDLLKFGPTAWNAQPARYVFVRSSAAKARLEPVLSDSNKEKTRNAPVTVIIAYDARFYELLPAQFPGAKLELFTGNAALTQATAFRNGTLQGAYLLVAARAVGLTVGPMSGFNADALDREFFPEGRYRANFLANIGYVDATVPRPRGPRLDFQEVANII